MNSFQLDELVAGHDLADAISAEVCVDDQASRGVPTENVYSHMEVLEHEEIGDKHWWDQTVA